MGNILNTPADAGPATAQQLRAGAGEQARLRNAAFERSRAAYAAGDHAGAKYYSQQGKMHAAKMQALNARAADAAYDGAARGCV
ncbi:hypothetical protein MNEG_11412 [Monoraphidium neglectum]|uniref:DUF1771 domain-containing protein n=1 Tax=Monoraphidium neglectum TaxID=145388 RepID=A0A0D2J9W0_9CHLO|nr:hypothetical protein MNEG_11412 [Monoraphidium neglectum]KIY96552.1 hypothetical protein MNEG_11412 [Monoraphidium neglectum]|eukprot:XP_013895572.1 hypothetical protein MNEG_11412 [Monoraphidium neglectum]